MCVWWESNSKRSLDARLQLSLPQGTPRDHPIPFSTFFPGCPYYRQSTRTSQRNAKKAFLSLSPSPCPASLSLSLCLNLFIYKNPRQHLFFLLLEENLLVLGLFLSLHCIGTNGDYLCFSDYLSCFIEANDVGLLQREEEMPKPVLESASRDTKASQRSFKV